MNSPSFSEDLKQEATRLGFDFCGIAPAVSPPGAESLWKWVESGYAGEMSYIADRASAYAEPGHVLDGARSIVLLGLNYRTADPVESEAGQGRVSRYAWGTDYHDVIRARLADLAKWIVQQRPACKVRGVVDTAPLLEREFAQLAGLGWIGKNTLLINRQMGSWFFLAALLTDLELEYDEPHQTDHCGTCRACLDACPTNAFVGEYVLDARRCISYLTIELRSPIPNELRADVGDWLFGCDVCQDVCPWNRFAPESREPLFAPAAEMNPVDLAALLNLSEAAFRERFRHTPLWRAKRRGLLRNAAIVLGNRPHPSAIAALIRGLNDDEPLVRGACAWALGRTSSGSARSALKQRSVVELDDDVRYEIASALEEEI